MVDCNDVSTDSMTMTARYDSFELTAGPNKSYFSISNWWNVFASQTEDLNGLSLTVNNPQNATVMSGDNNPMGFPTIFIGQYAGHTSTGSNLPKQVSALTSVPTIFETNNSMFGTSNHNATYDVWFTANNTPLPSTQSSPGTGGAYLMVWMFSPSNRQPRGSPGNRRGLTVSGVPGTWDVWLDPTGTAPCVSYVSSTPIDGLQFDLNDFIQDAVSHQYYVTPSMYLSLVFGGFEIWGNNDGLSLTRFCANVK